MDNEEDSGIIVDTILDPSQPVNIDPNGDVVLEVGIDPKVSLLVSSKVLSVSSEVFRALFRPHFKEGIKLAEKISGETYKLGLKDDDPNAMTTLCYMLHHQRQESETALGMDISELLELALLCDKYMCVEVIRTRSLVWVAELRATADVKELHKLLIVCYFLDEPAMFNQISKQLIMDSKKSFQQLFSEDSLHELLPVKIYVTLDNERSKLRHILDQGLQEPVAVLLRKELVPTKTTPDNKFGIVMHTWHQFGTHDAFVVSAYLRELSRLGIWPLKTTQMKVSKVLEKLHAFEEKEISTAFGFRIFGRNVNCQACMLDPRTALAKLIDKVTSENKGVCLDCMRKGESQEVECRVKHD